MEGSTLGLAAIRAIHASILILLGKSRCRVIKCFKLLHISFFEASSKPLAHGGNIVNVILVDFRGNDTLGEIDVVMVAALSILSLIRVRAGALRRADDPAETDGGRR